ncbi:MAG: ester cyclase [Chloroflexota bacterium]
MSTEANKTIALRYIDIINEWDLDALGEVIDKENFKEHNPAWGALSFDQALGTYQMLKAALPDLHFGGPPVLVIAEDDLVVIKGGVSGTHTGAPLFGVPATGKQLSWTGMDISRIANGKIVERWLEANMLGLMQQVGVIPPPG